MREIGGADGGLDAHRIAVVEHHGLVAMVVGVDVAHIEIQREQRRGGQHGREPRSPVDRLSVDEAAIHTTLKRARRGEEIVGDVGGELAVVDHEIHRDRREIRVDPQRGAEHGALPALDSFTHAYMRGR